MFCWCFSNFFIFPMKLSEIRCGLWEKKVKIIFFLGNIPLYNVCNNQNKSYFVRVQWDRRHCSLPDVDWIKDESMIRQIPCLDPHIILARHVTSKIIRSSKFWGTWMDWYARRILIPLEFSEWPKCYRIYTNIGRNMWFVLAPKQTNSF